MKNLIKLVLLGILFGCSNDIDLPVDRNCHLNVLSMDYCSGNGDCLPHVDVYHSTSGTVISWNGGGCGSYNLSCFGVGRDKSGIVGPSGTWYFDHSSNAYTFSYVIRCKQYSCSRCEHSGSFVKKNNNSGVLGPVNDCQKKYLSYSVERGRYGGFKLVMNSSWEQQQNTDDYLSVDGFQIYKSNYGNTPQLVANGTISPGVETSSFPDEPLQNYEIRFFSSACKHNDEHYLYGSYQGGSSYNIKILNLNTFKAHF